MTSTIIARLFDGPLDIIGDVHGEHDVLQALLAHLGYNKHGEHPRGRRLVFIGDLCDRGPDSPAVFSFVRHLVKENLAQVVLGNHELNVLRERWKDGNGWFFEVDHDRNKSRFTDSARASEVQRREFREWLRSMPIALQRDDLRVVHACWHQPSIDDLQARHATPGVLELYNTFEAATKARLEQSGLAKRAADEELKHKEEMAKGKDGNVPMLHAIAESDVIYQMSSPVRILTSGIERPAATPFYSSDKWRFTDRVPWWNDYQEQVPVVIGHYWRWANPADGKQSGKGGPDLFEGVEADEWMGMHRNVFCVDYSIGRRYAERKSNATQFATRLAALRWPEREVLFDIGSGVETR